MGNFSFCREQGGGSQVFPVLGSFAGAVGCVYLRAEFYPQHQDSGLVVQLWEAAVDSHPLAAASLFAPVLL